MHLGIDRQQAATLNSLRTMEWMPAPLSAERKACKHDDYFAGRPNNYHINSHFLTWMTSQRRANTPLETEIAIIYLPHPLVILLA